MKRPSCFLLCIVLLLSLTACGNDTEKTPGTEPATQETTQPATESPTTSTTVPAQNNDTVLQYYNDVAGIFHSSIEMHYNNSFEDAEFVCVADLADGTWEITDGEEPSGFSDMIADVISQVQAREFKSGPKATGMVLVKYEYGNLHYVQYKETAADGEVQIIGQYSDPTRVADGHIQWGVFHNRTRCDICANA